MTANLWLFTGQVVRLASMTYYTYTDCEADAAQISKLPLQDTAADRVQVLATFPLSSGGLPADFVPDILVYEAGRYVLIDETRRRIRVYNDREVNKAGVQGPQGNPEVPEEEL